MSGLGLVAQLVEHRTFNPLVASSSLAQPTKYTNDPQGRFFLSFTVATLAKLPLIKLSPAFDLGGVDAKLG